MTQAAGGGRTAITYVDAAVVGVAEPAEQRAA